MNYEKKENKYKILICGSDGIGKTQIITRIAENKLFN